MDRLVTLITNPWTWIIFGPIILLPFYLKYIRKLYPKSVQENIIQCEIKREKAAKKGFGKKEANATLALVFSSMILISPIYMMIDLLIYSELSNSHFLMKYIGSSFFFSLGILALFEEKLRRYIYRNDYKEAMSLVCESERKLSKINPYVGWIFIGMSILSFFTYGK